MRPFAKPVAGVIVTLTALSSSGQPLANAATEESTAKPVDELTVTARRKTEDLQAVPIAITAFTASQLELRDIVDLNRLADQTPGLSFATAGSLVNRRAVIRGMAQQTRVGDETNVATFVDGVYTPGFSGAEFFGFDSLERIEVVKGPQSALYGRNSFAGAINYITSRPAYDVDYGGRLTYGDYDRRGASAYFSAPLIDDTLAVRLDGGYNRSGGTYDNTLSGDPLGSTDTEFARLGLRWDPSERMRIFGSLSWQQDESEPVPLTQVADDSPSRVGKKALFFFSPFELSAGDGGPVGRVYSGSIDDQTDSFTVDPRAYAGDRDIWRGTLSFEYDFGSITLASLTGYQEREVDTLGDFNTCRRETRSAVCDGVNPDQLGTFFGGPIADTPQIINILTGTIEDRDELSQDLRLQSNGDGRIQWSAGIYYSEEDFTDQSQRLSDGNLSNPAQTNFYAIASPFPLVDTTTLIENTFYSIYASVSYDLTERLNISAEGRQTREEKIANQVENNWPTETAPTGLQKDNWYFFTPRFILSYTWNDELLTYASAAKGVKSGGFNPGAEPERSTYDQEENWTYEVGAKYTFADGRAVLNTAIYHVDWTDQQITAVAADGRTPITVNVAETEINGFELEGVVSASEWLQLNFGYNFLDAKYTEGVAESVANLVDCDALGLPCDNDLGFTLATSGNIAGKNVIGTPASSVNLGAQVNFPLPVSDWGFLGRLDYSWQDKQYIDEANIGYIPSRASVNLRLAVQDDHWSLQGYCNNLTDDQTPIFALPPRDILGVPHFFVVNRQGRMCGLQATFRNL
jgi:iron complex outermembrane receptor protein